MKQLLVATIVLFALPTISHAASIQVLAVNILAFINSIVLPTLIALALLFFVFNVLRFFIIESSNEAGREKARGLAIYGLSAFVLITAFWAIMNLVITSIGIGGGSAPKSDYEMLMDGSLDAGTEMGDFDMADFIPGSV